MRHLSRFPSTLVAPSQNIPAGASCILSMTKGTYISAFTLLVTSVLEKLVDTLRVAADSIEDFYMFAKA
jgi:hypothetical protein